MTSLVYNFLIHLAAPLGLTYAILRRLRREKPTEGWREKAGSLPAALIQRCAGRRVIWAHAASVGETAAVKPLLFRLRAARPGAVIVLSHATRTGRQMARSAPADGLFYLPLDLPLVVRRVIRALRPQLFFTIDTELYPNLIWTARRYGCRVALCNGRISDKSYRRIRRFHGEWLYRGMLPAVNRLLMQSSLDAARVEALGAPVEQIRLTGNLKFDETFPEVSPERLAWWHETLGLEPAAPVLLAGSTGPGEEEPVLAAFAQLREVRPEARLILVPRHIERTEQIAELVRQAGLVPLRRSKLPGEAGRSRAARAVVIVDTIGELAELFAVGTVAFVGRSLVPLGGSNVLQAAAQGKPVLTGPYVNNVRDSVAILTEAGVCWTVRDGTELGARLVALVTDPAELAAVESRAQRCLAANRGATDRTLAALLELLDARPD